jgi:hypothetical protein
MSDSEFIGGSFAFALEGGIRHRQKSRRERALLPNLTHITSRPQNVEDLRVLFHLISNRLVSLNISILWGRRTTSFPEMADCVRLVEEIILTSPKLNHLCFNLASDWTPTTLERAGVTLGALIETQPTLRRLEIDISILPFLTYKCYPMTSLVELRLTGKLQVADPKPMTSLSLPALRKIRVDVQSNIKGIWGCLLPSADGAIEDIEVEATTDIRHVVDLFEAIGQHCPSLRSLKLVCVLNGI